MEVGPAGEAAITLLANEAVRTRSRGHIKKVSTWLSHLGLGEGLEVFRVGRSDLFSAQVTLPDGNKYALADLGYGVSQVLPVLVQCAFAASGSTLLFEQPELHLHPLAAQRMAQVFIDTAKRTGGRILIETHSAHLVKGLLKEVGEGGLRTEQLIVYKVEREQGASRYREVMIQDDDVLENWERNFSTEW